MEEINKCILCNNKYKDIIEDYKKFIKINSKKLSNIFKIPFECGTYILNYAYGETPFSNIEIWDYHYYKDDDYDKDYDLIKKNILCCTSCLSERIWIAHSLNKQIPSTINELCNIKKKENRNISKFYNNKLYFMSNTYVCDGYCKPPLYIKEDKKGKKTYINI